MVRLPDRPEPGLVLCYAYLWKSESAVGRVEGTKDRPAVVVLARRIVAETELVYVAPMTHSPPLAPHEKIAVPPAVQERLGLDRGQAWISATELNVFAWPGPDLRPIHRSVAGDTEKFARYFGYLPRSLFRSLQAAIHRNWATGAAWMQ